MMFNDTLLARLRTRVNGFLTETCDISKRESGTDIYGGSTEQWVDVASAVACRVIRAGENNSSEAALVGDKRSIEDEYKLVVPTGTTLEAGYRVTVGAVAYQVVRIVDDRSQAMDVQAIVTRIR